MTEKWSDMKRILIAALAASAAVCLTACGGEKKNDGSGRVKKQPVDSVVTEGEDSVSAESDRESSAVSAAMSSAVSSAAETAAVGSGEPDEDISRAEDSSSGEKAEENGAVFTFTADESKWNTEQEGKSAELTYNGDDIPLAKGNCTIMINSREIEDMPERTLSEVADAIVDSKGLASSLTEIGRGESVLGGHDAYTLSYVYTVNNVRFDLDISVMAEDTTVLEVWVMSYEECTAAMEGHFEEVLKTVRFDP